MSVNPLNAELNPICHLLALLGAHYILHVSRIRVNTTLFTQLKCRHCAASRKVAGSIPDGVIGIFH